VCGWLAPLMVNVSAMKNRFLIFVGGVVAVLAAVLAYLSVYFTASQPENYGASRYKVYAWACIILGLAGVLLCAWSLVRGTSQPGAHEDNIERNDR
jgi:hypothetical protein